MPTTVTDASLTTARRRQLALYSWRAADQYSYNPQTLKREQGPAQGSKGTGPTRDASLGAALGAALVGQATQPTSESCNCSTPNLVTLQGFVKQTPAC